MLKEAILKKKRVKSEIKTLHIDDYGKVLCMLLFKKKLSLHLIVLHINDSPSLIFCSFFKRTSFTVVLSQRFYGPKPVCSSVNNVSILFVFEIKEPKEFRIFLMSHMAVFWLKNNRRSPICVDNWDSCQLYEFRKDTTTK